MDRSGHRLWRRSRPRCYPEGGEARFTASAPGRQL